MQQILYSSLIGYFLGCINPAYIISRFKGMDIRKHGSGNAGASNALIVYGKAIGVVSALFDIFKAYFAYRISVKLFPEVKGIGMVAGLFCILGHIFPLFMGFRGGKGLACLGGMILAYDPKVFFVFLLCELVIVLYVGYICAVPISASVAFTVYYAVVEQIPWVAVLSAAVSAIIILKHRENYIRIKEGKELKLSYLWNREEEKRRVTENSDK